ncbi:hypothetical protein KM043_015593 [Ampulex compressa]|nr:hypothetical protein KM043_015593 [Ampulex compressa]
MDSFRTVHIFASATATVSRGSPEERRFDQRGNADLQAGAPGPVQADEILASSFRRPLIVRGKVQRTKRFASATIVDPRRLIRTPDGSC